MSNAADEKNSQVAALLYLMGCALNGTVPLPDALADVDEGATLALANRHSVDALVAAAVLRMPGRHDAWQGAYDGSVFRLVTMDVEREEVFAGLDALGLDYVPLKGIVLAGLYPDPAMRQMADNDILFRCPDHAARLAVREFMEGRGYTTQYFEKGNEDVYLKLPVCNFELHVEMFPKGPVDSAVEYYANVWDRVTCNGGHAYSLSPTDHYVYMVAHMFKHYVQGGCGLRTLSDVYVLTWLHGEFQDAIDHTVASRELGRMGMAKFERDMRLLAKALLAPDVCPAEVLSSFSAHEREVLAYLLGSGTYGTLEHMYANALQETVGDTREEKLARYVARRLFPSPGQIYSQNAAIDRHRWLLPLFYPYRLVRGVVAHREKLAGELAFLKQEKSRAAEKG